MIRTIVAEDSPTVRQLLVEILGSDPEITVIGEAADGLEAIDLVSSLAPDLVVMDINMPGLDGLRATHEIMAQAPTPILIVTAADDRSQLELSLRATEAGALHLVPKPGSSDSPRFTEERDQLLMMAKAMARVKVVRRWISGANHLPTPIVRRVERAVDIELVTIASSTGGPLALRTLLQALPPDFPVPILAVQHIATGFAAGFASWLGEGCQLRVRLAEDGELPSPGIVYIAPDNMHLGLGDDGRIELANSPPIMGFRPSATYLFESVAQVMDGAVVAVVLTGMGDDGVAGLRTLYRAGGWVLAQDRESSAIYGMARAAVESGVVDRVLPLDEIAPKLIDLVVAGER